MKVTSSVGPEASTHPPHSTFSSAALGAGDAAAAIVELARRIGAPTSLEALGLNEEDLDEAVDLVAAVVPPSNPRPVDRGMLRALLENALYGRPPPQIDPVAAR